MSGKAKPRKPERATTQEAGHKPGARLRPDARVAPEAKQHPATAARPGVRRDLDAKGKGTHGQHPRPEISLLELYRPDIAHLLAELGTPPFRQDQVLDHLLQRLGASFAEATNLPLEIRASLDALGASTLAIQDKVSSADGATKLLLAARDEVDLETVVMRYRDRVTACISSQVGCPVGCAFCATGSLGFARNLTPAEIVDQVRVASTLVSAEERRLSNLVFMGMGEPLLNLQAVLGSIRILADPKGMNLAHRSISVSTVGIPNGIRRLAEAEPQVNLAISLHAANDRTRSLLIPDKFRHPLAEILDAAWEHFQLTRRKLLVEYVLIGGINDSIDDARRLASLLRGHVVSVNLLPWNPVQASFNRALTPGGSAREGLEFRPPSPQAVSAFRGALLTARIETVVRLSKGATIHAACGQLAGKRGKSTESPISAVEA
jgi:23S rRNA (adenine2503-C2)-methyltransferase